MTKAIICGASRGIKYLTLISTMVSILIVLSNNIAYAGQHTRVMNGEKEPIWNLIFKNYADSNFNKSKNKILAQVSSSENLSTVGNCDQSKKQSCEELLQDNILWNVEDPNSLSSKHWLQKNLDALCSCTTDSYATVNCFQIQVNNKRKAWQEAIAICRATP